METQIVCFEKFFSKFGSVETISTVVQQYNEAKDEIKKSVNRVIYLDELKKFQHRDKGLDAADKLQEKYLGSMEGMSNRFRSFNKPQDDAGAIRLKRQATSNEDEKAITSAAKQRPAALAFHKHQQAPLTSTSSKMRAVHSKIDGHGFNRSSSTVAGVRLTRGASSLAIIKSGRADSLVSLRQASGNNQPGPT